MPQTRTLYRLFLASPSDVKEEREIVKEIISEFNTFYSSKLCANIELYSWENRTYPSFGTYPQEVINKQVGNDFDIFLGILWTRFGTETLNFNSGTEEEFYNALDRYKKGDDVRIMMYFNIDGPPLNTLDLEQYSKVQEFQGKLSDLGCLYCNYFGSDNFKKDLLHHLFRVIEDWGTVVSKDNKVLEQLPVSFEISEDLDKLGLLEYQDILNTKTEESIKALVEISEATDWIGNQIVDHSNKLNALNSQNIQNKIQLGQGIINSTAKVMNQYAVKIDQPIQNWIMSNEQMIDSCKGLLEVSDEIISIEDWENNKNELNGLVNTINTSHLEISAFYDSVNQLPKMTKSIILAKNNVCSKLRKILDNMNKYQDSLNEIISLIETKVISLRNSL